MRTLYVGPLPPYPGGSARSAIQLLDGLVTLGHAVRALAPLESASTAPRQSFPATRFPVTAFAVSAFGFDHSNPPSEATRMREDVAARDAVERELREHRPEAIFVGREPFAALVVPLARQHDIPVLVRTPGGTMLEILAGRYPRTATTAILDALRNAQAVVSPARHLADAITAQLGIAGVRVVPNAIPLHLFSRRPDAKVRMGLDIDRPVAAHVSNLVACKRPLDLIPAAVRLRERGVMPVYLLAGDGPLRAELERQAAASRLDWRFLGQLPYDRVADVMSAADVLVMPGDADTMPRVYLEAMAIGTVVVASDIPASRELLDDGRSGLLFPVGDAAAQADAINRALTDAGLAHRLRAAARQQVEERDVATAAARYAAILASLDGEKT